MGTYRKAGEDDACDAGTCRVEDIHTSTCFWSDVDAGYFASSVHSGTTTFGTSRGCYHCQSPYCLEDGNVVFLSSHYERADRNMNVDLAFYLDGAWRPDCLAFHIGWYDFGLPTVNDEQVLELARLAHAYARESKMVEIGCLGAHGRTGTFLAIIELLAMGKANAAVAIAKVRAEHCSRAIETAEQEWYVHKIAALINGERVPAMPKRKVAKSKSTPKHIKTKRGSKR